MSIIKKITNELKQTEKITFVQLIQLTIYTIVFCAIIALVILGADLFFQWGLNKFMNL
ncbi:preprotein translocase subunit SecE [Candidatus Dojkabacteria bacterium]|uniref:Preprotein translocase subunit SecE n=1 Tax=Candidatus Dojkabacteria bacterium TaxID=2099670 RepID=A0A847VDB7_9BACT|nr:preprotein translocase subunit SecE [Candidatus Dojkabacteria bacterium]